MEITFHLNKTHFHKKGCAPSLILKVRVLELRSGQLDHRKAAIHSENAPVDFFSKSAAHKETVSISKHKIIYKLFQLLLIFLLIRFVNSDQITVGTL